MALDLTVPDAGGLEDVVRTLRGWQRDDAPIQLHPGDLGWHWRFGADGLAAVLRVWRRGGETVAIGFQDSPDVFRMTVAPEVWDDADVAVEIVADLSDPERGVLPAGKVSVEVPDGARVKDELSEDGWTDGDAWTPLRLDLTAPVPNPASRTEIVTTAEQISECTAVHRSAWGSAGLTDERWRTMAAGAPFADAWCLLARDDDGVAVATLTAWAAGPGRPALVEPLGVHADHRRRGHGSALCVAAAAHVREAGSSSVLVCTPSSLGSAVATYESAGYSRQLERLDRCRAG